MHHFLYETTNIRNNKTYVGVRSSKTDPMDSFDGYLGSGFVLKRAIKKYGKSSFTRKVLVLCDSKEYAFYLESLYVNDSFVSNPNTYNMTTGGSGGYIGKELYESAAFREAASLGAKEQSKAFVAEFGQEAMNDKMSSMSMCRTLESRERGAAKYKELYKDPVFMLKKKKSAKKGWQKENSEERRAQVSAESKERWAHKTQEERDEFSKRLSKRHKGCMTAFDVSTRESRRVTVEEYHVNPSLVNSSSKVAKELKLDKLNTESGLTVYTELPSIKMGFGTKVCVVNKELIPIIQDAGWELLDLRAN